MSDDGEMGTSAHDLVTAYIDELDGADVDLDRLTTTPPPLDFDGINAALADPRLREPGRQPVALQMMCDFMAPEGSIYFDAIYGDNHGQAAIRNWLIPVMATIEFVEFVPTSEAAIFDDGDGGSSVDEWQMFAKLGEESIPLSRGVSVRRFRDGWLSWACDVYDTGPFRIPPPPEMVEAVATDGEEPEPLPDPPTTDWQPDPDEDPIAASSIDLDATIAAFHPTDSVFHDPVAGEMRGRDAIGEWMRGRVGDLGDAVFRPLGPRLDDGTVSVREWLLVETQARGSDRRIRGTSVRRRDADGRIVLASDYYDTAD